MKNYILKEKETMEIIGEIALFPDEIRNVENAGFILILAD
jgi:hypothetical protein